MIYHEGDEGFFLSVGATASRSWIVIHAGDHETSENLLIPAADPTAKPRPLEPRLPACRCPS